jgi:thermitase
VRYAPGVEPSARASVRARSRATVRRDVAIPRAQVLRVPDVDAAVRRLERDPDVELVAPVYPRRAALVTPNDPLFASMWALPRIGMPAAWTRSTGSPGARVAVVDTGIARDHPEFRDAAGRARIPAGLGTDLIDRGTQPDDEDVYAHGTHVAGTIGATGNNGLGVAGIAWGAQLMPVRALDAEGFGSSILTAEAFQYAARNGARVVNASLSGTDETGDPFTSAVVRAHPDVLFVVAAGNGGTNVDAPGAAQYPCSLPHENLICVAATDDQDQLASFSQSGSNWGARSVDLAAPGRRILSTVSTRRVFQEDFERSLERWTMTPSSWEHKSDSEGFYASSPSGGSTLTTSVAGSNLRTCRLDYDASHVLGPGEFVAVERAVGGGGFEPVRENHRGSQGWRGYFADLKVSGASAISVRFRVQASAAGAFRLDDVEIRCRGFDATSYESASGTSMAAPHVAGAAALLLAADPTATPLELRDALLGGGDARDPLKGRTVSGRRLNVAGALHRLSLPWPVTGGARDVRPRRARLTGTVDPRGTDTRYAFQYGTTPWLGEVQPATPKPAGGGQHPVAAQATPRGLEPGTTYHYRVVAHRGSRTFPGATRTFTTARLPRFGIGARMGCSVRGTRGNRRARCTARAARAKRVNYVLKRRGKVLARASGRPGRPRVLRPRGVRSGRHNVVATLRDGAGGRVKVRRAVRF